MNEDILSVLLQAESEYHTAVKNAAEKGENYADNCIKKQNAYLDVLKQDWESFEKTENDRLKNMLAEDERRMENETEKQKEHLQISRKEKADIISERLKEEVLSLYGNR